jgi:probable F420-dependent oxidoreductase
MATTRKFRFGVAVTSEVTSAKACVELARKAEDLGYSTMLFSDHMSRSSAPLVISMAALSSTSTLRVGTQVLANPFRNPAILAKEIASLDMLSDGRFEPGIGAGWPSTSRTGRSDSDQTGIEMGGSGERVERLEDAVRIIKRFFSSEEPFDFEGTHFSVKGLVPFPRPVQRPQPPLMIAGAGPRLMRFAAREADIINIAPRPPIVGPTAAGSMGFGMTMADEVALIKEAAGERYADIELCVFSYNPGSKNPSITERADELIESLAAELNTTPEAVNGMPAALIGSEVALVDRIVSHRELYDITSRVVPDSAMEQFAPIVARLAGS